MVLLDIRSSSWTIDILTVDLWEEQRAAHVLEVVTLLTIDSCILVLAHGNGTDELILGLLRWHVQ